MVDSSALFNSDRCGSGSSPNPSLRNRVAKSWSLVSDAGLAVVAGVRGSTPGLILESPVYEWGAELVGVSVKEEADSSVRHAGNTRGVDGKSEAASKSGDVEAESVGDDEEGKEVVAMMGLLVSTPTPAS